MRNTSFIFSLVLLVVSIPGRTQNVVDAEVDRLRRENVKLRIENRKLEERLSELEKNRSRAVVSFLDSDDEGMRRRDDDFFDLTESWDELDTADDSVIPSPEAHADVSAADGISAVDTILVIPHDGALEKYIDIYTIRRRDAMAKILVRYDGYFPMIRKAFRRYGVPEDFSVLCIVESAANPKAVSKAGAAGLWQFMEASARDYGLDVRLYSDERFDPEKATDAAARYLRDLYRRYGDWGLAVMSYNCGPGGIDRALAACGDEVTYEKLYSLLPRETREYLPALVAAMYVNKNRNLIYE